MLHIFFLEDNALQPRMTLANQVVQTEFITKESTTAQNVSIASKKYKGNARANYKLKVTYQFPPHFLIAIQTFNLNLTKQNQNILTTP